MEPQGNTDRMPPILRKHFSNNPPPKRRPVQPRKPFSVPKKSGKKPLPKRPIRKTSATERQLERLVGEKESVRSKKPSTSSFVKERHRLAILLPVILTIFILILILQHMKVQQLLDAQDATQYRIAELEQQNTFYKKAYEITLDDIKALSKHYGGEDKYERRATELREEELGTILGNQTESGKHTIKNNLLWQEYERQGIVSTACLQEPYLVDTIQNEVLITIIAPSTDEISFYIDGNFLEAFSNSTGHQLTVIMPPGQHELDLVAKEGGIVLEQLRFDTIEVPVENAIVDHGLSWNVFDCDGVSAGNTLQNPGAIRISILKS